jgi:hypothetical protein
MGEAVMEVVGWVATVVVGMEVVGLVATVVAGLGAAMEAAG